MKTKFYQNEKFQRIFFPVLYFLLTIGIVITGCVIFYNKYYEPILIDGSSMMPTLVGGDPTGRTITVDGQQYSIYYRCHYGIADLHKNAVNNLKRFDVCVTHYPSSWGATSDTSIIKRVWGFPEETIKLTYDEDYTYKFTVTNKSGTFSYTASKTHITKKYECEYKVGKKTKYTTISNEFDVSKWTVSNSKDKRGTNKTFYTNNNQLYTRTFEITLGKNQYFVMGDNWGHSTDSYTERSKAEKLTKGYLEGKAVCITGYATAQGKNAINIHKIKERYNF